MGISAMTTILPDDWDQPSVKPYEVKYIINEPTKYELELLIADVNVLIHTIHYAEGRTTEKRYIDYVIVSYIYSEDSYRYSLLDDTDGWKNKK